MTSNSQNLSTMRDLLSSLYVGAALYGFCHMFHGIVDSGIVFSCATFGCVGLILNHFKINRAPLENCEVVFGGVAGVHVTPKRSLSNTKSTGVSSSGFDTEEGENISFDDSSCNKKNHGVALQEDSIHGSIQAVIVGHRGAGLDAPENSLSAFRLCKSRGCDFVEFDVALTKDNILVVFHDDDLLRMAGLRNKIIEMTFDELQRVDISLYHPLKAKFVGEKIPTFSEVVQLLLELKMRFFIDLKDTDSQVVNAVCDTFANNPEMYKIAVVSSFFAKVIYDIRRRDPKIIGCMAWRPNALQYKVWSVDRQNMERRYSFFLQNWLAGVWDCFHDWLMWRFHWWFLGLSAVLLHKDTVSKHELQTWQQRGVRVFVWTVNNPLEKLFFTENARVGYLTDTLHGDLLGS